MKWILFFNENCKASSRSRRISFHESLEEYQKRLVQAATIYLSSTYQILPVFIADDDDPYRTLETPSTLTFEEFLQQINSTTSIPSVIRSYHLLSSSAVDSANNLVRIMPPSVLLMMSILEIEWTQGEAVLPSPVVEGD
jgi:hypothetical protein